MLGYGGTEKIMEKITVKLPVPYDVTVGDGAAELLKEQLANRKFLVITDENVIKFYPNLFDKEHVCVLPAGEKSKSFEALQTILAEMFFRGLDRKSALVAFGGGVVGDVTGFAASIYMRGIDFYQLPTTLLADVDSSVGGKTAINFYGIKNNVGSFHQPTGVFIDPKFLTTLGEYELSCGMGEVVKTALLYRPLYETLTRGERYEYEQLIAMSVSFKADVVAADEREGAGRKILNLGHTLAHAFEAECLDGDMRHGDFVLTGLLYELEMSRMLGCIDEEKFNEIKKFLLTRKVQRLPITNLARFCERLKSDKKNAGDRISFILLRDVAEPFEKLLTLDETLKILKEIG